MALHVSITMPWIVLSGARKRTIRSRKLLPAQIMPSVFFFMETVMCVLSLCAEYAQNYHHQLYISSVSLVFIVFVVVLQHIINSNTFKSMLAQYVFSLCEAINFLLCFLILKMEINRLKLYNVFGADTAVFC